VRFRTGTTQEYSLCRDCQQHCRSVSFVSLSRRVCIFFVCCSVLQPLLRLSATLPVCRFRVSFASLSRLFRVSFVSRLYLFRVLQPLSRPSATLPVCLCRVSCVSFSCATVCCSLCRDRQQYYRCVSFVSPVYVFRVLQIFARHCPQQDMGDRLKAMSVCGAQNEKSPLIGLIGP